MDEIRNALAAHGRCRTAARTKLLAESDAIRALAPKALEAGIGKTEIARLAQISRPALDEMLQSDRPA